MRYTVALYGGLGDVVLKYLLPGGDSGFLADWRAAFPELFVRCSIMSTAPAAADLFAECTLFDEIKFETWDGDLSGFKNRAGADLPASRRMVWRRPKIFLTRDETDQAAALACPFIALHPFAGTANRDWRNKGIDLDTLVDQLCGAGICVVLLGGSSRRTEGKSSVCTVDLLERCDIMRPGLVNLVGQSVRLQMHLAMQATAFIGSFSSYYCAAFAMGTPAYVLAGAAMENFFATAHPVFGILNHRTGARFDYFERMPLDIIERLVQFSKANAHV